MSFRARKKLYGIPLAEIYPGSFTNVRCPAKIEFSNIVKCSCGSRDEVNSKTG